MTTQPIPAELRKAGETFLDSALGDGIESVTLSVGGPEQHRESVTVTADDWQARKATAARNAPDHQQSFDAVAAPLDELAERVARLHVNIREHAEEMKGDRKELRELKTTLKDRLAESGYIGEQQLEIPGFRGYSGFTFSVETKETPIMVESGDTKPSTTLKLGSKRIKGWRR